MSYRLADGIKFLKSLPDKSVDGMFTDPPWGYAGIKIEGQDIWKELIGDMTEECLRIFKPGARALIWVGMRAMVDAAKSVRGLEYKWTIFVNYYPPRYIACFESLLDPILFYSLPGEKFPKRGKKIRQLYEKVSTGKPDTHHPCARPFETVKNMLRDWFDEGEYVIDPFAGSDTVGVACRELNLKYDTCEIDPRMYRYGLERNSQMYLFEK